MTLNKQKGNMYGFITHTWNPLAGECPHKCVYCSTKALMRYPSTAAKYSGEPRLDEKCLKDNLGQGNFIFVCAQNDLFADEVDWMDIAQIMAVCEAHPLNRYLLQTKNPIRYIGLDHYTNFIFGTTIETNRDQVEVSSAPSVDSRVIWMKEVAKFRKTMVTIEPILDFDLAEMVDLVTTCKPEWVNIGADSKGHKLPEPNAEKVLELKGSLEFMGIKVIGKDNLERLGVPL